jgi:hypothetical protein
MIDPQPRGGLVDLPVGTYCLSAVTIGAQDDEGRKWESEGSSHTAQNTVDVKEGETAPFPVGEPFELKISAGVAGSGAKTGFLGALAGALSGEAVEPVESEKKISLNVSIVGAGGETYSRFLIDEKPAAAPRFVVKDQDGKQVDSGQFEYG